MDQDYHLGMIGLGVMGRNLALNLADHGYAVAGYDRDPAKTQALEKEGTGLPVAGATTPEALVGMLRRPRAIMVLVPAGAPVDDVIHGLAPHLEAGDVLMDGGNSHYTDTERRGRALAAQGIHFLGVGISGGEHGARYGPSLMPGGDRDGYEVVRPMLESVAARANGEPCVAHLGPRSAGHYVKMVHNGIEYGLMQILAESYDLLKRGAGLDDDALHATYDAWNHTEVASFLIEITADIFSQPDTRTGGHLIDAILDEAGQKGTGMWTSQEAMSVQVPVPIIDMAVAMRHLSGLKEERLAASQALRGPSDGHQGQQQVLLNRLRPAVFVASILAYAQGMALLRTGSQAHEYDLDLETVARIWRAGCIIRAAVLEDIRAALHARPDLPNLVLDARLGRAVMDHQDDLRAVVTAAAELGLPAPGLMAALAYFDGYRSAWLPANLIQAERDFFGAHTYERVDTPGTFHTEWQQD